MDSDLNFLLRVQPTLNPWLVVLLGSIAGILAFAICSALHVRHKRSRRSPLAHGHTLAARLRQIVIAAAAAYVVLMGVRTVPGPTLVETRGWLYGEDLFTVAARPGFSASFPTRAREVERGGVILHLVRDAGPEEIASATSRRAVLLQDLEFARLETLHIDPLLLAAHATATERLEDLQSALRELEQTASSLKAANASLKIAHRPGAEGLFSGDEVVKRTERVEVLRSRYAELNDRVIHLTGGAQGVKASSKNELRPNYVELAKAQEGIGKLRTQVASAWKAVEQDRIRAETQHQHRVRQIELQIAELDELLDPRFEALEVRAPWSGVVGFRESSPASIRTGNRPLLVLYRPGTVGVRLHIPAGHSSPGVGDAVEISMRVLLAEAADTTFTGTITQKLHHADGSAELLIAGDPPGAALRELAQGNSVPVNTVTRYTNPMADVATVWWAMLAALLGITIVEIRHHLRQRHTTRVNAVPSGENRWLGLHWGGDAGEYLEFVVGVGIVRRRVRGDAPAIKTVDDPHRAPEPVAADVVLKSA